MDSSLAKNVQDLSIQFVPFVMAVVFHEYAHGWMAHRWGDDTAKTAGRLTLNPLPHLDPIGTLLFPLINMLSGMTLLFGWARPVPINPSLFKKYRPGLFWVSLAGPSMNFLLAFVSALAFWSFRLWVPEGFYLQEPLLEMSKASIVLNCSLGIFNLIPMPPLDGSKIIESALPMELARKYESVAQYSFFILMALLLSGALSVLRHPILFMANGTLYLTGSLLTLVESLLQGVFR